QRLDPLLERLEGPPTLVDEAIDELAAEILGTQKLRIAALTVPFPGTLYGALRLARALRRLAPALKVILGGGYVSTELRALAEPRLFRYVDYVCLDRGFMPMLGVLRHMMTHDDGDLVRTFTASDDRVAFHDHPVEEPRHADLPAPCMQGLHLDRYIGLAEMLNPMHVLWSRQRWNKIMAAHGCYWHRCAFCDTSLDYIRNYDPAPPARIADWMAAMQAETGSAGFHIVDEALSPALARGLSEEILRRGMVVSWWGNVRFEAAFDDDLARLMARAGCIAVTGGLEALDDRLLGVLNKGITVAQAARACAALSRAGMMVHAYLIYGVPSQTTQETIDALERLRQMVALGLIRSAYWHRFAATAHSPVGADPERFGVSLQRHETAFAENEIPMLDPADQDREALGRGLHRATYNYMHGRELDRDVREWFDLAVPRPRVPHDAIERCLHGEDDAVQASPADAAPARRSPPGRLQPRPPPRRPRGR
ncbi:MAG: radical SAM protein, partial [Lentisphaerae bacterium]|nr:radical SAM protein [Lentisphaerota bacterium]